MAKFSPKLILLAFGICLLGIPAFGQDSADTPAEKKKKAGYVAPKPDPLFLSFERAEWRDVIKWLADQCDLALHFENLPTGTFSYSDFRGFSQQEAIDRINLFLLPQGFTLVRSGRLLSVINMSDPRSLQQLDALAEFVDPEKLASRLDHDVVKCLFPLGQLTAEDAVEELSAISLMTTPKVFNKTNQIMITDTVARLKNVKTILDAFRPIALDNGTVVKSFRLEHVSAEDILLVARPHLGLATGEMIGIDVSISADIQGKNIFVTGVQDKVTLIANLIEEIDKPLKVATDAEDNLQSHLVRGGNLETVYNVLQTLFSGESIRLSMDEASSSIVALAPKDTQKEIASTVAQLAASDQQFEVIPLKTVDPYFAISLLEEMLDLSSFSSFDDDDEEVQDQPKIDADPGNMRLFVRGKPHQIEQIRTIVEGLDSGESREEQRIRILPLRGKLAEDMLETAAKFWRDENPVIYFPNKSESGDEATERTINQPEAKPKTKTKLTAVSERRISTAKFLTDNIDSNAPAIRCQFTPRGLILQSDDASALGKFEEHLRTIVGPTDSMPSPPIVFYLKYTKPDDALRMLAELLDGGESAKEAEAGTLVNGYVSSSGSFLGSILTTRGGTSTMMAGTITVVADPRLNRLIAQGTTSDIELIESYLEIIDKDTSLTEIETYGIAKIIELNHTSATVVAESIREAFASRIASGAAGGGAGAQGQGRPQNPAADKNQDRSKGKDSDDGEENRKGGKEKANTASRGGGAQASQALEPKMTIAVHEPSNSLIVTAPEPLFLQVERLAKMIDERSEETVELLTPVNGSVLQAILDPSSTSSSRNSSTATSRSRTSSSRSSDASRSRALEALKERFGR